MSEEANKHHVYLAIPGVNFCWGTVTGVVHSTSKHVAFPFNGGLGFSGVIDFNILWTDAINLFEAGKVTHFAMLHGDLEPDPDQYWIDILLEEMDARDAELVSVHSPIKDHRGVTSSGICDPSRPWSAFRRFTQREILNELPETFNHVLAGYPEKPLLHNTGCWVADLRKPIFREVDERGCLKSMFEFPERLVRNSEGKWEHQQESEDWHFSRRLWERGVKNTWITSKVRLTHHGKMAWQNWLKDWGEFQHGDEHTAPQWRKEANSLPLAMTQLLEFELGSKCNMGAVHDSCPNMHPERYGSLDTSRELTDEAIVSCAVRAYNELGFSGLVGWIFYNEPLLQSERMFRLMAEIKSQAPRARFILWTNGTLIPENVEPFKQFSQIVVSDYGTQSMRGVERLKAGQVDCRVIRNAVLDDRLVQLEPEKPEEPCVRPFVELIIDNYGNTHLCCYDWQGKGTCGNVFSEDFGDIARRWRGQLPTICGEKMTPDAPEVCRGCNHRWQKYQMHDESIVARVRAYRAELIRDQQQARFAAAGAAIELADVPESCGAVTP